MGTNSKIEWTEHTWNPWRGCTKVSPACDNCYMYRDAKRFGIDPAVVQATSKRTFFAPNAVNRDGMYKWTDGSMVFVCSLSDFFHPSAGEFRSAAWDVMRTRPGLLFQLLTKRPERIATCLPDDWNGGWPNVWLGVTAENQEMADARIPILLSVPAAKRFVSVEPMLEQIDLARFLVPDQEHNGLDWVICGGETGRASRRPLHPKWVRSIRDQCQAASVPFFFKQWGEWVTENQAPDDIVLPGESWIPKGWRGKKYEDSVFRVGKKNAGCLLDGREWKEFPGIAKTQDDRSTD